MGYQSYLEKLNWGKAFGVYSQSLSSDSDPQAAKGYVLWGNHRSSFGEKIQEWILNHM